MQIDNIQVIRPPNYLHYQAFDEVAESFRSALCEAGQDVTLIKSMAFPRWGRSIVFGAHLLQEDILPPGDIVFQSEQVCDRSVWMTKSYFDILKSHEVWDYSPKNIEVLARHGIKARHCPIGYMPCMRNIYKQAETVDVLFIGSMNARRQAVIEALQGAGVNAIRVFEIYGWERDDLIAKAKIILNIHYYGSAIHEIFRTSYLMANSKCIVSETGNDEALEAPYKEAMQWSKYGDIVKDCLTLLENHGARESIGDKGFEIFSARKQIDILRGLV